MGVISSIDHVELAASPAEDKELLHREFRQSLGQITRHSAIFFAGTIFTLACGYFVKIYVVRILGAELLGIYALGMTLVSLAQLFGLMGLPGAAARYVAVYSATGKIDQLRTFLFKASVFVFFLNFVMAAGMLLRGGWIARHLYRTPELSRYIPAFALLTLLGALSGFYAQVLAGFKDIGKRTVITNFVGTPLVLLLTVVLLVAGTRLWGYLAAQVVASGVVVILLVHAAWRMTPVAVRDCTAPLLPLNRDVFSFSAASFAMSGIDFLSSQADKVLIGFYLAAKSVGIYVLASTLAAFVPLVLQSVNQIFAPVIADLHAQARYDVLRKLFQTLTKWVFALTLPVAIVVVAFAPQIMRLFGTDFENGWPVLVIIAVGQVVNCAVGSVGNLLLMSGNEKRLMKVQLVTAILSIAVNVWLIPVLGIIGAALAAAAVNAGSNVWNLIEVRKALHISPYNRGYYDLVFPAGLTIGSLALLRLLTASVSQQWVVLLLALLLGYGVFAISFTAFGMDEDDRRIASDAWRQVRCGLQRSGVIA